jgi:hypothetical protein
MIIGIDLDNTVIDYTEAFLFGARQLKLIPKEWTGKKLKLKSFRFVFPFPENHLY